MQEKNVILRVEGGAKTHEYIITKQNIKVHEQSWFPYGYQGSINEHASST